MNGRVEVHVSLGRKYQYDFVLNRKFTFIRGGSGEGKTVLASYVEQATREIAGFNVNARNLHTGKKIPFLRGGFGENWKKQLVDFHDTVFIYDEDDPFIKSNEFAELASSSHNYFIIVSRYRHSNIPYSEKEIYQIKNSGKYNTIEPLHKTNDKFPIEKREYSAVLTEDSGSGYQFFSLLFPDSNVIPAKSNSKIPRILENLLGNKSDKRILVIYDSAAFGPYIQQIEDICRRFPQRIDIFAPESFEYLLLRSDMFKGQLPVDDLLTASWNYANDKHASWERFFTALLIRITETRKRALYSKSSLSSCYKSNCCHLHDSCVFFAEGDKIEGIIRSYNTSFYTSNVFQQRKPKGD